MKACGGLESSPHADPKTRHLAPISPLLYRQAHFLSEPPLLARLGLCSCCGGGALVPERLLHASSRLLLLHADSRHVHFVPDEVHDHQSAEYRASGGVHSADPNRHDALLRLLAEQEAESARSFRWYWGVLPLLLLGGGIGLLLAGVDS